MILSIGVPTNTAHNYVSLNTPVCEFSGAQKRKLYLFKQKICLTMNNLGLLHNLFLLETIFAHQNKFRAMKKLLSLLGCIHTFCCLGLQQANKFVND